MNLNLILPSDVIRNLSVNMYDNVTLKLNYVVFSGNNVRVTIDDELTNFIEEYGPIKHLIYLHRHATIILTKTGEVYSKGTGPFLGLGYDKKEGVTEFTKVDIPGFVHQLTFDDTYLSANTDGSFYYWGGRIFTQTTPEEFDYTLKNSGNKLDPKSIVKMVSSNKYPKRYTSMLDDNGNVYYSDDLEKVVEIKLDSKVIDIESNIDHVRILDENGNLYEHQYYSNDFDGSPFLYTVMTNVKTISNKGAYILTEDNKMFRADKHHLMNLPEDSIPTNQIFGVWDLIYLDNDDDIVIISGYDDNTYDERVKRGEVNMDENLERQYGMIDLQFEDFLNYTQNHNIINIKVYVTAGGPRNFKMVVIYE